MYKWEQGQKQELGWRVSVALSLHNNYVLHIQGNAGKGNTDTIPTITSKVFVFVTDGIGFHGNTGTNLNNAVSIRNRQYRFADRLYSVLST